MSKEKQKGFLKKELIPLVIGVLLGGLVSMGSTIWYDSYKDSKKVKAHAKTIYLELENINYDLLSRVISRPLSELVVQSRITANIFNKPVLNRILDDIHLFDQDIAIKMYALNGQVDFLNDAYMNIIRNYDNVEDNKVRHMFYWNSYYYRTIIQALVTSRSLGYLLRAKHEISSADERENLIRDLEKKFMALNPSFENEFSTERADVLFEKIRQRINTKETGTNT